MGEVGGKMAERWQTANEQMSEMTDESRGKERKATVCTHVYKDLFENL